MAHALLSRLQPIEPGQRRNAIKVLTAKEQERFNKIYGELKGQAYLDALHIWENHYGYWEDIPQFN